MAGGGVAGRGTVKLASDDQLDVGGLDRTGTCNTGWGRPRGVMTEALCIGEARIVVVQKEAAQSGWCLEGQPGDFSRWNRRVQESARFFQFSERGVFFGRHGLGAFGTNQILHGGIHHTRPEGHSGNVRFFSRYQACEMGQAGFGHAIGAPSLDGLDRGARADIDNAATGGP